MVNTIAIRTKVRNLITNKVPSSATVYHQGATTYDKWGDETEVFDAGTAIAMIPFNEVAPNWIRESFGDLQVKGFTMICRDDTTISVGDKVTYNSVDYDVTTIEPLSLKDTVLAQQVTLVKRT